MPLPSRRAAIVAVSMVADRLGYGRCLACAFLCHIASTVMLLLAKGYWGLYAGTFLVSIGNGAAQAIADPVVATMFRHFCRQLAPAQVDRLYITYGGRARELPNTDPVTRAILQGFLSRASVENLNNINVRSVASTLGISVEEKRSEEPVTFNEWLHVQVFNEGQKVVSAGGTFFGSPENPRIVRVFSMPTEIIPSGVVFMLNNKDRPGMVGYLGTLLAKHNINIASMSLSRDEAGGQAFTVLNLDSVPPQPVMEELQNDSDISNVRVVKL